MKEVTVVISRLAEKQIEKCPVHIRKLFYSWMELIQFVGLFEARKIESYRDHALKGSLWGLRSVSLNRSYRIIYKMEAGEKLVILIVEVNKHDYKI